MQKFQIMLIMIIISILCNIKHSHADTVIMRDNERIKGIVVEEYNDRIVLSSIEGEKQIMREGIKRIIFDLEEQNLTNLAEYYQDRQMYKEAYYYYNKALKINPEYKKAIDGHDYIATYLRQADRMAKLRHIQRQNDESRWQQGLPSYDDMNSKETQLKDSLGIILESVKELFVVSEVISGSPAAKAGIKKEDVLLFVWGRATSYMQFKELINKLVTPGVMDIKVTIGRSFRLKLADNFANYTDIIGADLGFSEMEGLIVKHVKSGGLAESAGIKEDDVIVEVQGKSTRYMPLDEVRDIILSKKGNNLMLKIKRDKTMWKKFTVNKN